MIIKLEKETKESVIDAIKKMIEKEERIIVENEASDCKIIGIIGDSKDIDRNVISCMKGVIDIIDETEKYKRTNRKFHPDDTIISIDDERTVGGDNLMIISGPCAVESEEQIKKKKKRVKNAGAKYLRGGVFKPRTSPYDFQGLQYEGLELLKKAREITGLKIVTEIMSTDDIELYEKEVDVIQVGSRNMQNFDLLKRLGKLNKPILLKRGLSATIEEWLMAAEYIMSEGNPNVILCERGIRTYETATRNTLDISAIPLIKKMSHLPIIVDPSHAAGIRWMIEPLSKAAVAIGADGLIIEVHNNPDKALSDGAQSVTPDMFDTIIEDIKPIATAIGRSL